MPLRALAIQHFNTANAHAREQRWAEALLNYQQALQADPSLALAHLGCARCQVQLAQWAPAQAAFEALLQALPDQYSGWLEWGHLCRQMGELDAAIGHYQRALTLAPHRYEAALGLVRVLEQQGHLSEAAPFEQQALHNASLLGDAYTLQHAWHLLGQYRLERGDAVRALPTLRQALALARQLPNPEQQRNEAAEVLLDLAELLLKNQHTERALPLLSEASGSEREATLARLMQLSLRYNLWVEAIEVGRRCLALHPQSAAAHWNLAHLLAECWQMREAEALLQQAQTMAPIPGATTLRAQMAARLGEADKALALYQQHWATQPEDRVIASSIAMCALYCDSLSAAEVAALHRRLFEHLAPDAAPSAALWARPPLHDPQGQPRRIRLGLLSADLHFQHPVNIFMQPVLRELDRSRFEVVVYFTGVSVDDQTHLAKSRVDAWVECTALNDAQLAKRIQADALDILVDLSGHTGHNRMAVFAQRVAPVQVTYLGYPGSTGVPNMDWLIGDEVVTPHGCEALYSERIARLPGTVFCYAPEENYPYPRYTDWHGRRPLTLGSFNNVPKLTPHTLRLWARVMHALPQAQLLLKAPSFSDASAIEAFTERLQQEGIDPKRVTFRGPVGLYDMMAEYADIDMALDPVPYNGGTTTLQALWMGVPVVVKEGEHFVSRMGASFMRAAGLPDWVASDDDAYVAIAVAKAQDRTALLSLKQGLRERLQSLPAWDCVAHTRAIEQALIHMLEPHDPVAGARPSPGKGKRLAKT